MYSYDIIGYIEDGQDVYCTSCCPCGDVPIFAEDTETHDWSCIECGRTLVED
jgi:hypothetical protein